MIVNRKVLADILERDMQTIRVWQKSGLPVHGIGERRETQYNVLSVIEWYAKAHLGAQSVGDTILTYTDERARLTKHQADKAAIEVEILEGKHLLTSQVNEDWGRILIAVKTSLLALPGRLTQMLSLAKGQREIIAEEINTTLEKLADTKIEDNKTSVKSSKTDKATDSNPVGRKKQDSVG